jgi:hypothetical protein
MHHLQAQFDSSKDVGVASLYLNHKEATLQSPANLLASLWWQLMADKPLGASVYRLYEQHQERQTRPTLEDVGKVLGSAVAEFSKVYIIVDALDEHPEQERGWLLNYLAGMGPTINVMLTSRPHIAQDDTVLPNLQSFEICAMPEDIQQYIDGQIKESGRLSKHVNMRPELREEIKTKILDTLDGM